jgi:hypothetical protein
MGSDAGSTSVQDHDAGSGEVGFDVGSTSTHDDGNAGEMDGSGGEAGSDALVVPEGLTIMPLAGGNGVLDLIALTLRKGPSNTELYAAMRNDGDVPACDPGLSVELFDKTQQSLATGISALLTKHFYRLTDGSGTIASCVGPGDVAMAAVTDLSSDIVIDDVGYVVYRCPYFALDVAPVDGLSVSQVQSVTNSAGTAYAGTLLNGFDAAVSNPAVTVFPVNHVGRPLGVATGSGTADIPPGDTWAFETNTVDDPGVDYVAYPTAALMN